MKMLAIHSTIYYVFILFYTNAGTPCDAPYDGVGVEQYCGMPGRSISSK